MKKVLVSLLLLILCGIIFAQTAKNLDYPNTKPFMRFWQKLRDYSSNGKVDLSNNYDVRIQGNFPDKKISEGKLQFEINENSPEMKELLHDFLSAVDESNLLKIIALESLDEKVTAADLRIKFDADNADFKLSLKANSDKTAKKIASRFGLLLSITASFVAGSPEEEFYKNAVVTAEQNEIFVNGKISRQNLINYINYGFMSEETKLEKDTSCYVIVFAEPFEKKEFDKIYIPRFQLLDVCPKREPGLAYQEAKIKIRREGKEFETSFEPIRTFANKAEAKEFADKYGIKDESMLLNDIPKCHLIRLINMPLRKKNDQPTTPTIALLDVCLPPEARNIQHPVITFEENGKKVSRIFEVIKTFTDKAEAEKYAKENGITDIELEEK